MANFFDFRKSLIAFPSQKYWTLLHPKFSLMPMHDKLPRLVLVVCTTCNCYNAEWVRKQWNTIDALWASDCKAEVGPIVGHASDGDSRRRQLMLYDYKNEAGNRLSVD